MNRPPEGYGIDVLVDAQDNSAEAMQEFARVLRLSEGEFQVFGGA
jgi:hypothetical protein